MAKFSKGKVTSKVKVPKGPLATATVPTTRTALGALAYKRDQKSELFLLAVSNFVGVDLFHEKAPARDDRFEKLCHAVAVGDPEWFLNFVTWLRKGGNMRSASLVAGAEGTRALLAAGSTDGWARKLINAPLQRADEPGEMLAYWARYSEVKTGKALKLPKPVKRGVADAVRRLYTDRNLLKWDTAARACASPTSSNWSTRCRTRRSPGKACSSSTPWTAATSATTTTPARPARSSTTTLCASVSPTATSACSPTRRPCAMRA